MSDTPCLFVIGFTGSRNGGSAERVDALRETMRTIASGRPFTLIHGDCVGWDVLAHGVARELGGKVVVAPAFPLGHPMRAGCAADFVLRIEAPLVRNEGIVRRSQAMIAAPDGPEVQRSGTWATVRMARRAGKEPHFV